MNDLTIKTFSSSEKRPVQDIEDIFKKCKGGEDPTIRQAVDGSWAPWQIKLNGTFVVRRLIHRQLRKS